MAEEHRSLSSGVPRHVHLQTQNFRSLLFVSVCQLWARSPSVFCLPRVHTCKQWSVVLPGFMFSCNGVSCSVCDFCLRGIPFWRWSHTVLCWCSSVVFIVWSGQWGFLKSFTGGLRGQNPFPHHDVTSLHGDICKVQRQQCPQRMALFSRWGLRAVFPVVFPTEPCG